MAGPDLQAVPQSCDAGTGRAHPAYCCYAGRDPRAAGRLPPGGVAALAAQGRPRVVAVAVSDERTLHAARSLARQVDEVRAVGLARCPDEPNLRRFPSLHEAVAGAGAVVVTSGVSQSHPGLFCYLGSPGQERVGPDWLQRLAPSGQVFTLQAPAWLRAAVRQGPWQLVELEQDEVFLQRNAVLTAEGALELAMQHMSVTLHANRAVVVGLGRCGQQLASRLAALGSRVWAVTFHPLEQARAWAMGIPAVPPEGLARVVRRACVVFNTAPAPVLTEPVLRRMQPDCLIVDIASGSGGTDFEAAFRLGIPYIHARGIPARTAPKTAGQLLAQRVVAWLGVPQGSGVDIRTGEQEA